MKIAIISSGFLPVVDGVTVALYQRVRILSQRGYQVLLLCPDYRILESIYPNWYHYIGEILPGVEVISLPSEPFLGVEFERNLSWSAYDSLKKALQIFQPDIIHVDEPDRIFIGLWRIPGIAYARNHNIPCFGFYHTNFIDYIEDFFRFPSPGIQLIKCGAMQMLRHVFQAYDATLVATPVTENRLRQIGIHNTICDRFLGVDVKTFQKQSRDPNFFANHYELGDMRDRVKLLFVGRLTPDKGWRFALQAFTDWVNHPDSRNWVNRMALIIAGEGELAQEIQEKLQSLGLMVYLLGRISPEQVPSLFVNSDIHITVSEKETLGLTILEAFAAGIPVIAPQAGGIVDLVQQEKNGLLFTPKDTSSFRRSLLRLLLDPDWRQTMGKQGQKDANSYDWNAAVTNLVDIWQSQFPSQKLK